MKLEEYLNNILLERKVSHFLNLGLCLIVMTRNVNNSKKLFFKSFYIT